MTAFFELIDQRRAGVLLPVYSLPNDRDFGDFDNVPRFLKLLTDMGMSVWQILPLGPAHADRSPYLSLSAHAGKHARNTDRLL